jgi:hypothetical protein
MIILSNKAKMITNELYSAFNESNAVKAPGPASKGKIMGTMVALFVGLSILNISTPKVISQAITNRTTDPATAKEDTSTLNNRKIPSPTKKKAKRIRKEKKEAF